MKRLPKPLIIFIGIIDAIGHGFLVLAIIGILILMVNTGPIDSLSLPISIGFGIGTLGALGWVARYFILHYRAILQEKEKS